MPMRVSSRMGPLRQSSKQGGSRCHSPLLERSCGTPFAHPPNTSAPVPLLWWSTICRGQRLARTWPHRRSAEPPRRHAGTPTSSVGHSWATGPVGGSSLPATIRSRTPSHASTCSRDSPVGFQQRGGAAPAPCPFSFFSRGASSMNGMPTAACEPLQLRSCTARRQARGICKGGLGGSRLRCRLSTCELKEQGRRGPANPRGIREWLAHLHRLKIQMRERPLTIRHCFA